jgi:hypothetical protein
MSWSVGDALTASALNAVTVSDVATYTPVVGNAGTVTWSTRTGWYYKIGKAVFWNAYLVATNAGSGTSNVSITSPSNPDRSTRQVVTVEGENINVASPAFRSGWVLSLTGGSGASWDRIRLVNDAADGIANLIGNQISNTSIITIQGWYREA